MENGLKDLLAKKKQQMEAHVAKPNARPANPKWEEAKEFCDYLGLGTDRGMIIFILGLGKRYGAGKVYGLKSWLKDANYDRERTKGLLVWKLKGGKFK